MSKDSLRLVLGNNVEIQGDWSRSGLALCVELRHTGLALCVGAFEFNRRLFVVLSEKRWYEFKICGLFY